MHKVNETEVEFDYYLSLARLWDEGYPTIPHVHDCISPTRPPEKTEGREGRIQKQEEGAPLGVSTPAGTDPGQGPATQ